MSNISFGEYTKPESTNKSVEKYADPIAQLIQATDAWNGELGVKQPSMTITVDVETLGTEKAYVQAAARAAGKTAKIVNTDVTKTTVTGQDEKGRDVLAGEASFTVTIVPKHKPRRGAQKGSPAAPAAQSEAVPEAADPEAPAAG